MATNIEIKASYPDLAKGHEIAARLGAIRQASQRQRDTYFEVAAGRLKLRETDDAAWLIPYFRPDDTTAKRSDYELIPVAQPDHARQLFERMLGITLVVEKVRDIYLLDNIRLHLDQVHGLGQFIEFEAVFSSEDPQAEAHNRARVDQLLRDFAIEPSALIRGSYHDLLLEKNAAAAVGS